MYPEDGPTSTNFDLNMDLNLNSPQSEDSPKWEPGNSADLEMAQ